MFKKIEQKLIEIGDRMPWELKLLLGFTSVIGLYIGISLFFQATPGM